MFNQIEANVVEDCEFVIVICLAHLKVFIRVIRSILDYVFLGLSYRSGWVGFRFRSYINKSENP